MIWVVLSGDSESGVNEVMWLVTRMASICCEAKEVKARMAADSFTDRSIMSVNCRNG